MSDNTATELRSEHEKNTVPAFGYELIREILLPEILGNDTPEILYWAGKQLARKFPLQNFNEIIGFFIEAGWGQLEIKQEKKNELELELSCPLIIERLQINESAQFQLEAGFIAQQIEYQKGMITETYEHPRKRRSKILFTVKWDKKDSSGE